MGLTRHISKLRWDSSDPDRAPPPLPLNPGTASPTTRPNTSANIAAAAQALAEKARESAPASTYTTNPMPPKSPERSLIKGAAHKRMQSLQNGNVRDLRNYLDGARSPERSPERSSTLSGTPTLNDRDYLSSSPERSPTRSSTPTPLGRDLMKDTPVLRPSTRPPPKAILGENTPPSATMLALQTMPVRDLDPPFTNITNTNTMRPPQSFEAVSSQILNLTTIATNLQREMAQLSRRSKDNATDLISLKEATHSRDEDIRKSLRELVTSVNLSSSYAGFLGPPPTSRASSGFGMSSHYLDNKAHNSPPSATKSVTVPRIPSFMAEGRDGSPSPYSVEGAASVAMLEKIIREMVTKEGQERLLSTLSELLDKSCKDSVETAKKVEELVEFIREKSHGQTLVTQANSDGPPKLELDFDPQSGALTRVTREDGRQDHGNDNGQKPFSSPRAADFVSADMLNLLRKIKDSVGENGGMTAEVKALVRELRGEVLGMGRELGRKLDQADTPRNSDRAVEDSQSTEELGHIIQDGLAELKEHMERIIREKRRQSSSSSISRNGVDGQEVYQVVKHALQEQGYEASREAPAQSAGLDKEGILAAVKEAYEEYKPEIELQQFGLERDEILEVLKEGLEDYQSNRALPESHGISKDEVMDAMQQALQHFTPPAPVTELGGIKEELLATVRDCLEDLRPAVQTVSSSREVGITREAVLDAVKEGLATHGPSAPREIEIGRQDLFDAVRSGLDGSERLFGEQVLSRLQELVDNMHVEFKQYSAANGRDTEQVLDAVKDGLETLRAEIESYVDRAQDVTGKDEIVDTVRSGLEHLRLDVQGYCARGPTGDNALSRTEMLKYIKSEFEHLHETVGTQIVPGGGSSADREEILAALREGFETLRSHSTSHDTYNEPSEEILEAMKEEFEQLRDAVLSGSGSHKDEVMEAIQEGFGSLHAKIGSRDTETGGSSEEVVIPMREEFQHLREILATSLIKSGGSANTEDIIDGVRETIEGLRTQLSADNSDASNETLGAIKEGFEHLRETLGSQVVLAGPGSNNEELLEALKSGLEEVRASAGRTAAQGVNEEVLETIRGELEHLRQSVANTIVHSGSRADTEEVLDTVRLGLDDLRSHLEKKLDSPERQMSLNNDILDVLNDGLDTLRTDVSKMVNKPVDMTVTYEILDTLRDGLAGLRADIDKLKTTRDDDRPEMPRGGEIVLADGLDGPISRDVPASAGISAADGLKRNDLENMEVLLAQLQIRIEAMDANIQSPREFVPAYSPTHPAEGTVMKEDIFGIETTLRELQATVTFIAAREQMESKNAVKKEDTDAIETLLRNTKAQIEDLMLPDPTTAVSRADLDAVEAVVRMTHDAVEGVASKLDGNAATKQDIDVVEVLVQDMKLALDEVRISMPSAPTEGEAEKVTKTDLDAIGILCTEIKTKIEEMTFPDADALPSKTDVEQLTGLIHDFHRSYDKSKNSYETDIAVTAKAFDDRKKEAEDLVDRISEVKAYLKDVKHELRSKIEAGNQSTDAIRDTLKSLEEAFGANHTVGNDIKELVETVNREFERTHGAIEGMKVEQEQSSATLFEKHEEHKSTIVAEVLKKVDACFDGLMTKYDDAQIAAEETTKAMDERAIQQEEILTNTKAMAEELKLTIDTLGMTVTSLASTFTEATEKVSDDSKTVFNRVDETFSRLNEAHADGMVEHQLTREEVVKTFEAIGGLQGDFTEFHPRFMTTLREVLALVGQHYEHSKKSQDTVHNHVRAAAEESKSQVEELKNTLSKGFSTLPALMTAPAVFPVAAAEKYDDSAVHDKLNNLLNHASDASKASAQLDRLDQIHQQVMATAAEVSAFVAVQTRQITEDHESKEKEVEEVSLMLERRCLQKEQLESDITGLSDEKNALRTAVEALRAEKEALAAQKMRLAADVSSLETALTIRREELHTMDAKADALERRILEGIMDHSRAALLTKTAKVQKPVGRDLRKTSNVSNATVPHTGPLSGVNMGHSLAPKTRPSARRNGALPNTAERRIMSLSQITNNVPTGAQAHSPTPSALSGAFGGALKRCHSVKTQGLRKSSWAGRGNRNVSISDADKENSMLSEDSEVTYDNEDLESENGTERRLSYATATGTESERTHGTGSYGTGSYTDGVTPSTDGDRRTSYGTGGSELTYGTGSYMTGSDADRRTSYGSTNRSTVGARTAVDEEAEDSEGEFHSGGDEKEDFEEEVTMQRQIGEAKKNAMIPFAPPSDSGLGTDLPTATFPGSEKDYFMRASGEA